MWFAELPRKLYDAARNYPLDQKPDWDELKDVEEIVKFEGVTAYSESAVWTTASVSWPGAWRSS